MVRVIFIFCSIFLFSSTTLLAQKIDWIEFDELNKKMRAEPRPILIFIHTDWCKFCAMQDNNTFRQQEIVEHLNNKYYCLRLNGESEEDIVFLNRTYGFKASGANTGSHELAVFLGNENGELTYPTTVVLSKFFQPVYRTSGFIDKDVMMEMIGMTEEE